MGQVGQWGVQKCVMTQGEFVISPISALRGIVVSLRRTDVRLALHDLRALNLAKSQTHPVIM